MNFREIRDQFDRVQRTISDASFEDYRDDWLNQAWLFLSQMFIIPSLKRVALIDTEADQQEYPVPYDYSGTEAFFYFKKSDTSQYARLDPVTEEVLGLMYERRTGNMGPVRYYDWTRTVGSDLAARDVTLVNGSATVTCATAAAADADSWVRFDPFTDAVTNVDYNPGDYGYLISSVNAGVSWVLDRAYRGPDGDTTGRVRPAEQQQFTLYGIPDAAVTDGIKLVYYANPRRLYNDADVPEWPDMGMPIAHMGIAIGYDYIHSPELSKMWYGRAMQRVTNLKNRRERTKVLTTDLTIGSVSGRRTGPTGVVHGSSRIWR